METYGKLSSLLGFGNLLSMNFDIFLNKNTMRFFFGVETSMGLYITDPGIQDESSQKITSFQNLRESMWMRCLTFVFNVAFFCWKKTKKRAWPGLFRPPPCTCLSYTGTLALLLSPAANRKKNSISGEGKEMRNLFRVQKELNLGYKHQWALPNDMKAIPSRRILLVFQCSSCMSAFAPTLIFIN